MRHGWRRLLPDTLFGRLVTILVGGMLAAQALTGTVWFDIRRHHAVELPARAAAHRLADVLTLRAAGVPGSTLAALHAPDFTFESSPSAAPPRRQDRLADDTQTLIARVLAERLGRAMPVRVLDVRTEDAAGRSPGFWAWFGGESLTTYLTVQVQDGAQWWTVTTHAQPGWGDKTPGTTFLDYFLRIYLLRILVIAALALVAVRMVVRPIDTLARAAEAIGGDLARPPVPEQGPAEARRAAHALNRMQQRLRDSLAERTRFLAAVSHDLRTPITRLRLRAEMLDDPALRERFRSDLEDMDAMTRAALDVMRGSEVSEARQRVDMASLLTSLASDMQEMGKDVTVVGDTPHPLPGYPRSLRRCLQNLLDNAVRYGGNARIRVADTSENLEITVEDDGPGMPAEALERVLAPFTRLEPDHRRGDGFGLGLNIAATIAQAHGGTLRLENRPEGGLAARLRFPRAPA